MNRSIIVIVLAILISGIAQAQTSAPQIEEERQFHIYAVAGLARPSGGGSNFQVGGGVEIFLLEGLSAGGEFSRIIADGGGVNNLSANGTYHLMGQSRSKKFDPYVTGGYSRFFGSDGGTNALNFGGGVNYWLSEGLGLKADFRDYYVRGGGNSIGLRGGIVFGF
jgi:hypothetical protein